MKPQNLHFIKQQTLTKSWLSDIGLWNHSINQRHDLLKSGSSVLKAWTKHWWYQCWYLTTRSQRSTLDVTVAEDAWCWLVKLIKYFRWSANLEIESKSIQRQTESKQLLFTNTLSIYVIIIYISWRELVN